MSSSHRTVLKLTIDNNKRNKTPWLSSLAILNNNELQLLMKYFLLEVYKFSNFSKFNDSEDSLLKFQTYTSSLYSKTLIFALAKSNGDLRLSHPNWDIEYGIET